MVDLACPGCGRIQAAQAPSGLCPACLLRAGLEDSQGPLTLEDTADGHLLDEGLEPGALFPDSSPEFLGKYQDLGLIGEGGMGEVRRVRDPELNRIVAMKIIRPHLLRSRDVLARFLEEAQATAQLQHPGIVPLYEAGKLPDDRYYFTMKEVRGRTLGEVISAIHPGGSHDDRGTEPQGWTFRRLIDAFHKVCETVSYAHDRGVVHRDLKPSNVMLGDFGEVLVMDWGLARVRGAVDRLAFAEEPAPVVTDRSRDPVRATRLGQVSGTPTYMPPEQARGEVDKMGPPSDVYALGAILYEILSGRPPYTGRSPGEILQKVLAGGPRAVWIRPKAPPGAAGPVPPRVDHRPSPTSLENDDSDRWEEDPRIPLELREICERAMARDPARRYPDASALAQAVADWLEGAQRRDRASAVLATVQAMPAEVTALREQASSLRKASEVLLSEVKAHEPVERKQAGWALEDEAERLSLEADLKEVAYLQGLRGSLTHDAELVEAHERLAAHYHAEHEDAEARKDPRAAARLEVLLRAHDRQGRHAAYLKGEGSLTLVTRPEGATVDLYRYELTERRLVPQLIRTIGRTPLWAEPLPMGSYLLRARAEGRAEVRYPVYIGRTTRWDGVPPGCAAPFPIDLPAVDELEEDDVYIPAGWFWSGGDPEGWNSLPRRRVWVDGFVMRRFQVTNREYLEFLNDLVATGREEEALRLAPREKAGGLGESGTLIYGREGDGRFVLRADAEGDLWAPDWPVCMVDWHGARAFAAWEAARQSRPWRLPMELEWEKAARGVDGRFFPWGDFADPTWARMLESLPGKPGPAGIDSYPVDESPYGVRGMGGNMRDWCLDEYSREGPRLDGERMVVSVDAGDRGFRVSHGGSWNGTLRALRSTVRFHSLPGIRSAVVSFRLVRPLKSPPRGRSCRA